MDVGYSAGMMNKRVTIAKRLKDQQGSFGNSQPKYEVIGDFWAAENFNRGMKSLKDGNFDAYDIVMFRLYYNEQFDRWCILKYQGKWYQIQSFNADYQTKKVQITAIEMSNQKVHIVTPSSSDLTNENQIGEI